MTAEQYDFLVTVQIIGFGTLIFFLSMLVGRML